MPVILLQSQPPTNLWFLFVAFAVTWLIFFVYAFFISRRRQDLEREIGDLQRELHGGDGDEEGGAGGQAEE